MKTLSPPQAFPPSVLECVRGIESGRWTAEQLVRASLERACAREHELHAWAYLGIDEAWPRLANSIARLAKACCTAYRSA